MKIEKVKNEVIKKFEELKVGEAFIPKNYFTSDICIKTYRFFSNEFDELKENWYLARQKETLFSIEPLK